MRTAELRADFELFDSDGSGKLDPGELRVDPDLSEVGDSVGVLKVHVLTVEELLSPSDGLVQEYRRLE